MRVSVSKGLVKFTVVCLAFLPVHLPPHKRFGRRLLGTLVKILFVCTYNKLRSRTAEDLFKDDVRFEVKSAGTSESAPTQLSKELLEWADYTFVMEKSHIKQIRERYPDIYKKKKIVCLYIEDVYDYMDPELKELLKTKVNSYFK